jgi:hypothetical protein
MIEKNGHRYKQPSVESIIEFLEENYKVIIEIQELIKGYLA